MQATMHIGINQVLIYDRASGARHRELALLPGVLQALETIGWEASVFVGEKISRKLLIQLVGDRMIERAVRTQLPAMPTWQRVIKGGIYWPQAVRKQRINLLHSAYVPMPKLDIPTVLTVHDVRFRLMPRTYSQWRYLYLKVMMPLSLRRATRIIADSWDTKNDLMRFFGVSSKKIDVVYIPADKKFQPVNDPKAFEQVKKRYHLPSSFILCVGHLEPRKNLERLVAAYDQLVREKGIQQHLVILGKPSFGFETLFSRVADSQVQEKIHLTGYVADEDMATVYSMADLLVFASLHEGFGIPLLEAMACQLPIVTSNCSALPEIAGGCAELVDPRNVHSIANGLLNVIQNPEKRKRMGLAGRKRILQFNQKNAVQKTLNCYRHALEDSKK